jgi:zinc and cadmium transporter
MHNETACQVGAALLALGGVLGALVPGLGAVWERHRDGLLSGSAGLLIGTAALHLLPEASGLGSNQGYALLAGFLGVLVLEAVIHAVLPAVLAEDTAHVAVHAHDHGHHEELHLHHVGVDAHERHLSISAFLGFALHGVVDGVGIHASSLAGAVWVTVAALLAHHIPLAVSCAALLKLGGQTRYFWPLMVAASAMPVLGVNVAEQLGSAAEWLSGIAAGVFLYVASHNLLPLVDRHQGNVRRVALILAGAAVPLTTKLAGG